MPAQLVALTDGPSILLDKPILLIGRHPECDIQIESRKVSRRHCCIAQVGDNLVVRDLGSTNGVRINGVRVVEGRLNVGDELSIGSHRYQIRWDSLTGSIPTGKSPLKQPAPPVPVAKPVIADILESWDDPVPLAEPVPESAANAGPDLPRSLAPAASVMVPDNLQLAPASDVFPSPLAPQAAPQPQAEQAGS
jgi:pSer/pThr/pTyr-binding forkhead associated (FHA) protein